MPTQVHIDKFDFHLTVQKQAEKFRDAIGVPKGRGVRISWPLFINVAFDFGPDVPSDDDDCIRLNLNSWKMQGKFINQLNPHAIEDYQKLIGVNKPQDKPKKAKKLKARVVKVFEVKDEVKADVQEVKLDDPINPNHYRQGDVECIDCIESATSNLTGFEGFCTGNAIKYLYRWKQKGGRQDLEKARYYINKLLGEKSC
jgi:hypothetical protein